MHWDSRGFISDRVDIAERLAVLAHKDRIGDLQIDWVIRKCHNRAMITIDWTTGVLRMGYIKTKSTKEVQLKTRELFN